MAFDYKKEYKGLYMPKATPTIVEVPEMRFIAVNGGGNPNEPDGEYQQALGILYPVAYTLFYRSPFYTPISMVSLNTLYRHLKVYGGLTMPSQMISQISQLSDGLQ